VISNEKEEYDKYLEDRACPAIVGNCKVLLLLHTILTASNIPIIYYILIHKPGLDDNLTRMGSIQPPVEPSWRE